MAIQLGHAVGARVMTTAGSADKLAQCAELGARVTIDYKHQDFVAEVKTATEGHGADVILDNMGAKYLGRNVDALATEGRLLVIGLMGGTRGELDLNQLMTKRGALISTRLRPRPVAEKAAICAAVVEHVWPLVADGTIKPVVGASIPLAEAARAHALMESGESSGKILLTVS
jgi:NADPH:quinone reductase-like Zn-dependent oxidoreductase